MNTLRCQFLSFGVRLELKTLSLFTLFLALVFATYGSAQQNPQYGSISACNGMTVGTPAYGGNGGALNGFVPFPATNAWNVNIANAPIDPNSAAIMAIYNAANSGKGYSIRPVFGEAPNDGGIPYIVVDSTETPSVPITNVAYGSEGDVVVAPYPAGDAVPLEVDEADCSGWPDIYQGDAHALVVDRATCFEYETYNTNRCNGLFNADSETLWDMTENELRPWGWTSGDAAGLSIFAGLLKYEEAASGAVNHAVRFTVQKTLRDSNQGYFVLPASHAAGSVVYSKAGIQDAVEGMRLRLRAGSVNLSNYSLTNQAILVGLEQYGMIMADNGGNFEIVGDTDTRWNDSDLSNLYGTFPVTSLDFDVVQMGPAYPGMDNSAAGTTNPATGTMTSADGLYPETAPVIDSFTATATSVNPGTPVTFDYSITTSTPSAVYGTPDSYAYIDNIGPVRISSTGLNTGSVTITPTATQSYTLYAANSGGSVNSNAVTVTVIGSAVAPPVIAPAGGTYTSNASLAVTLSTPSAAPTPSGVMNATYYYTTNKGAGSSGAVLPPPPTIASTQYTGVGTGGNAISISNSGGWETISAIAVVPGSSTPSAVSSATYYFGSAAGADAPILNPPPGTYNTPQTISFSDSTANVTIFYTSTLGTTGTAPSSAPDASFAALVSSGGKPTAPTYAFNNNTGCYGCPPAATITISKTTTIEAVATNGTLNSAVATGTYTIQASTPTFSPAAGNYVGTQAVTISSLTPSATIYYTTDGSTPATTSNIYSSPISVIASETIKALAIAGGTLNSAIGSAAYTIQAPAIITSPSPGSMLTGTSTTFTWTPGTGVYIYELWVGTGYVSSSNIYNSGVLTAGTTSAAVTGLPTNGATVYVRLWTFVGGAWYSTDYTFTAPGTPTPAALTSPVAIQLAGPTVTFGWSGGIGVSGYELWVGTGYASSSNVYNSGLLPPATSSETVTVPSYGETVYVRLYSLINGVWQYTDYTFTASGQPSQAVLKTPVPGSTLAGASVPFTWSGGLGVSYYELWVGTGYPSSSNIYNSGLLSSTTTTETVSGLPINGATVFARLYSLINGAWQYTDYTFAGGQSTKAMLTMPVQGSTLTSASQQFTWTGNGPTNYELWVGTGYAGSSNIYNSGFLAATTTTETVSGLPTDGVPVYVRLYSLINGAWQITDYTFTASGQPTQAVLTMPTPGSTLTGTSQQFTWTGNGPTYYELWVGTGYLSSSNIYNSGLLSGATTTATVTGLPTNGATVYVRLYSLINGAWQFTDYTFTAE